MLVIGPSYCCIVDAIPIMGKNTWLFDAPGAAAGADTIALGGH